MTELNYSSKINDLLDSLNGKENYNATGLTVMRRAKDADGCLRVKSQFYCSDTAYVYLYVHNENEYFYKSSISKNTENEVINTFYLSKYPGYYDIKYILGDNVLQEITKQTFPMNFINQNISCKVSGNTVTVSFNEENLPKGGEHLIVYDKEESKNMDQFRKEIVLFKGTRTIKFDMSKNGDYVIKVFPTAYHNYNNAFIAYSEFTI